MDKPEKNAQRQEQSDKLESSLRRADHLTSFATLTSMVSTAVYFVEKMIQAKIPTWNVPQWAVKSTVASIGVGMAGFVASYYYKFKAGKIAVDLKTHYGHEHPAPDAAVISSVMPQNPELAKQWAVAIQNRRPQSQGVQH